MTTIQGKRAVVTGAASGIGRAISLALAEEGAELRLVDIDAEGLRETGDACRQLTVGEVEEIRCDLSRSEEVSRLSSRLLAEGGVDLLVNNAGVVYYGPTAKMSAEVRERLLAVNLHAPIQLTCELLPSLTDREGAHVVNIASMYGLIAVPRTSVYHATKFGLVGFTESLRRECGRRGLGVTTICPGMIRTKLFASGASGFENRDVPEPPAWSSSTPERVAAKTIRAIRRDRRLVLVTPLAHVASWAQRLAPWLPDMLYRFGRRRKMRVLRQQREARLQDGHSTREAA